MLAEPLFLNIHMYGIMIAIGILFAYLILFFLTKKKQIDTQFTDFIFYSSLISIAAGIFSAAVFQVTYNFIENPDMGFHLNGGLTFIGGLIGGTLCFLTIYLFFRKKYATRLYRVTSILPCCILIAHAFGRIGCFFAGCCYGKETDSFLGVQFPQLSHPVYPTQLYEAVFLFILFFICFYLLLKKDFKHNLSLYLISYGIFRYFLEYLRGDNRGELIGLITPSQFWSLLMILLGIILIFVIKNLYQRKGK